jgi:hypothetical protein
VAEAVRHYNMTTYKKRFTLFPKFPKELRVMVWKQAIPGPRIVEITRSFRHRPGSTNREFQLKARTTIPAMLHVNSEAREIAQKIYKPLFKKVLGHAIYFNPDIDFFYIINSHDFMHLIRSSDNDSDEEKPRNLIVDCTGLWVVWNFLSSMASLSTLIVTRMGGDGVEDDMLMKNWGIFKGN